MGQDEWEESMILFEGDFDETGLVGIDPQFDLDFVFAAADRKFVIASGDIIEDEVFVPQGIVVDGVAGVGGCGGVGGGGIYAAQGDWHITGGGAVGPTDSPGDDTPVREGIEPQEGVVGGVVAVLTDADFKVEVGAVGDAAGSGKGDDVFGGYTLADGDENLGEVGVKVKDGLAVQGRVELDNDDIAVEIE